jgi:hypothetical protein
MGTFVPDGLKQKRATRIVPLVYVAHGRVLSCSAPIEFWI